MHPGSPVSQAERPAAVHPGDVRRSGSVGTVDGAVVEIEAVLEARPDRGRVDARRTAAQLRVRQVEVRLARLRRIRILALVVRGANRLVPVPQVRELRMAMQGE